MAHRKYATFRAAAIAEAEARAFSADRERQRRPLVLDWLTGRPVEYADNVISFPAGSPFPNRRGPDGASDLELCRVKNYAVAG